MKYNVVPIQEVHPAAMHKLMSAIYNEVHNNISVYADFYIRPSWQAVMLETCKMTILNSIEDIIMGRE